MVDEEYITFAADDLPEGHPLRRLAALWEHHTDDEQCWCEPTVHRGDGVTFVEHNVVAEDDA